MENEQTVTPEEELEQTPETTEGTQPVSYTHLRAHET